MDVILPIDRRDPDMARQCHGANGSSSSAVGSCREHFDDPVQPADAGQQYGFVNPLISERRHPQPSVSSNRRGFWGSKLQIQPEHMLLSGVFGSRVR